jgi:tetratricopeptide (TPR) repeat protein
MHNFRATIINNRKPNLASSGERMRKLVIIIMIYLIPFCWSGRGFADTDCTQAAAEIISLQGEAAFDAKANGEWHTAQLNEKLCEGGQIWVKPNSRVSLALPGNDVLRLNENTVLTLKAINFNKASILDIVKGFIHFIARKPKEVKIESGIANAAPLGTEFAFSVDASKAALWVYEGGVKFYNQQGSINLSSGQAAEAYLGKAPQIRMDIKPQDAVNWALYYPALLPASDGVQSADPAISAAIGEYHKGRIDLALQRLDAISIAQQTPYFHKIRGAMRLIVGQVDLAQQDIKTVQANKPHDADALALQSVIALTQNRKDEAFSLAQQAIAANPQSAMAYTALSYAEQGRFNLDKALASAESAVNNAPNDAMALARKAELELTQGLLSDSKRSVQQAINQNANLERPQTIKGYTHLQSMDTDEAMQAFNKAIALDSASPLARLGLGLAKIRDGDLEEGRRDLEIAAVLDPNNSLIRSYLGKAYYEEKRSDRAEEQFKLAKERDPKDPTPYYYNAIKKQTENRPIEALEDLQKAMELNDNREVYRSKLMLDKDLAARGAALGRIYNELGFSQRGLVEGWRGVAQDPTDYTSHRLLSDSYSALPRHDVARSSELLQSQLLQPINITPVQPRLAESQLFLLGGLGPSALSLNEFNPLFERNKFSLLTSGIVGSNNTYSDEVVHSGLWDNFSYSLGQFHYQTDGFRRNNDIDVNIYNAFVQARITPEFNVQAEYRHRNTDRGNLDSFFNAPIGTPQTNFVNASRRPSSSDLYRLGVHISPTNHSDLLGSFMHIDQQTTLGTTEFKVPPFTNRAVLGEVQYVHNFDKIKSILGGGYYWLDTSESILKNGNGYLYNHFRYPVTIDWTLGISFNILDDTQFRKVIRSINPKFGMQWNITPNTLLRAAAFRTVNTARLPYQTIEPVQVAGFNQFYDDVYRTKAVRWGVGLDHKFDSTLSGGVEISQRFLDKPIAHTGGVETETRWRESNYRAYFLWTPHPRWEATLEYFRENFQDRGKVDACDTNTQTIPLGLGYFDPSGVFVKFKSSFYYQNVSLNLLCDRSDIATHSVEKSDKAVFLDLSLGYRLPKRHGIFEVQFQNLLDQNYRYEGMQVRQSDQINDNGVPLFLPFTPEFTIFARLTLAL